MSTFTLPIFLFDHFQFALIHGPNIPGSYAILLFTASDLASITSPIHSWVLFLLWLHPFILSGVISPLITGLLPTRGVHLSVSYLFAFSYCSWGSQGQNTEVVCHSLLQWSTFCQTSPPWPIRLGWPHTAWLSFIELDKAVVHVIRFASFLWLWFLSVCPLMPSLSAYHLTWVSLTLAWDISSWLLQQSPATAPYLGHGVAPLSHCPWPCMWVCSSRPLPLMLDGIGYYTVFPSQRPVIFWCPSRRW